MWENHVVQQVNSCRACLIVACDIADRLWLVYVDWAAYRMQQCVATVAKVGTDFVIFCL